MKIKCKNISKKICLIFAIFISMFIILSINKSYATEYTLSDDISATLDSDGKLTVSGTGEMPDYTTSNIAPWREADIEVKSVVINEGITKIGARSFQKCTSIISVSLPSSLVTIGDYAFANSDAIVKMDFNEGLEKIGARSFYGCISMSSVSLPNSLVTIGEYAFVNCKALTQITFNEGLEEIGVYAFSQSSLISVTIPATVTSIGDAAFYGVETLTEFIVDANNTNYYTYDGALYCKAKSLTNNPQIIEYPAGSDKTEYTIEEGTKEIGKFAFYLSKNLKTVNIPDSIVSIEDYAFVHSGITNIIIPEVEIELGDYIFHYCSNLEYMEFNASISNFPLGTLDNCSSLKEITFNGSVSFFYESSFSNYPLLEKVTLPNGLTKLNSRTFYNCPKLTQVVWSDSLTAVSESAFVKCDSLTETYPEGFILQSDGYYCFPFDSIKITGTFDYERCKEIFDMVNEERENNGLAPLIMSQELFETAKQRAAELAVFPSHTRPNGRNCTTIFPTSNYSMGENLQTGFSTTKGVMNVWMNSEGHKANILDQGYTSIGIGCFYHNGLYYWVQCFGTGGTEMTEYPDNETKQVTIEILEEYMTYEFVDDSIIVDIKDGTKEVELQGYYETSTRTSTNYFIIDNVSFTFEIENEDIATIDENGVITPKSIGTTTINVTTPNGDIISTNLTVTGDSLVYTTLETQDVDDITTIIVDANQTISSLLTSDNFPVIDNSYTVKVYNSSDEEKEGTEKVGSKNVIKITDPTGANVVKEYTVVVKGDVNGDGKVKIYDAFQILKQVLFKGSSSFSNIEVLICDYNGDSKVKMYDAFAYLKQSLFGKN